MTTAIIGCREHGWSHRLVCCGLLATGDGVADSTLGMRDTGDHTSAFTVGLITDSATAASALWVANGAAARSITTAP